MFMLTSSRFLNFQIGHRSDFNRKFSISWNPTGHQFLRLEIGSVALKIRCLNQPLNTAESLTRGKFRQCTYAQCGKVTLGSPRQQLLHPAGLQRVQVVNAALGRQPGMLQTLCRAKPMPGINDLESRLIKLFGPSFTIVCNKLERLSFASLSSLIYVCG